MKVIVSGAAGFIGAHAAQRFIERGATVIGTDNLSRRGAAENLAWIKSLGGDFHFHHADIRKSDDIDQLFAAHADAGAIIHLAGQVAVTTSVKNPRQDFEANALGTLNMLEAARRYAPEAAFLFASTNKVYGGTENVRIVEQGGRYAFRDHPDGLSEEQPLDFHSPYGCSKGAADQYVRDYARIYGLKTVVFRQSCIYGTRQFGIEDQGWVAWFSIAAVLGWPITVYGDGKQIRDVLWIGDLMDLYCAAIDRLDVAAGKIYNAGGGPANTLSLRELLASLEELLGRPVPVLSGDWRPGDQRVFVANVGKAAAELGWKPSTSPAEGVRRIVEWSLSQRELLQRILRSE